jgi:ribonuclease D
VVDRYELLRAWRRDRGQARGVESDIILSRDAMWAIAHENPQTREALAAILGPWRLKTYGEELLDVLAGDS